MNKSYNHIKHFVDTNDYGKGTVPQLRVVRQQVKHEANHLDGKQRHTGFDHYDYDMSKFGTPRRTQISINQIRLYFHEHLEDLDHNQARN